MVKARPDGQSLVFVDLETTGANFSRDRILEVGLVEVDQHGVREWNSLVNPGVSVSSFITGLTGIDDSMVADAPCFEKIAGEIAERLRGRIFIAHNARFDYGFLKAEFARLGMEFRATVLCTVKLSRKLYPEHHRHGLDVLIERHGLHANARHRALADAQILWDLWKKWHTELGTDHVRRITDRLTRPPTLPDSLDPALADELPDCAGAYAFLDGDDTLLLVGKATNLRQKVLSLFADARASKPPASQVQHVEWQGAAGEFGARLGEIAFQRRIRPIPAELCAWKLEEMATGDFRPTLVFSENTQFGVEDDLFGLYATKKEARHALKKLAEAHFLCPVVLGLEDVKEGKSCSAVKTGTCRGVCTGREAVSRHSARLMTAMAKLKLKQWPYAGPVALVERDEFGMHEDYHLFDHWRYLGRAKDESGFQALLESGRDCLFDPDVYRAFLKYIQGSRLRVITLPAAS